MVLAALTPATNRLLPCAALQAPPAPPVYPQQKKVVDDYVIILACVLGGLLLLPLLAWLVRRCYLARQHRKVGGSEGGGKCVCVTRQVAK